MRNSQTYGHEAYLPNIIGSMRITIREIAETNTHQTMFDTIKSYSVNSRLSHPVIVLWQSICAFFIFLIFSLSVETTIAMADIRNPISIPRTSIEDSLKPCQSISISENRWRIIANATNNAGIPISQYHFLDFTSLLILKKLKK